MAKTSRIPAFKKDMAKLLKKYNAEIDINTDYDGDVEGIEFSLSFPDGEYSRFEYFTMGGIIFKACDFE